MRTILRNLPLPETVKPILVQGELIYRRPFQILVWITLCRKSDTVYDERAPLVPAILDTGFNGDFSIREEQLIAWSRVSPDVFPRVAVRQLSRGMVDIRAANLWLHRT